MSFRTVDGNAATVTITVDGEEVRVPVDRSLLAGMAVAGLPAAFFCAIGQCQRCVVWVNGERKIACLTVPRAGDEVRTEPRATV